MEKVCGFYNIISGTRSSLVVDVLEVLGLGVLPDDHFGHVGEELDKLQEVHLAVVIVVEEVDDLLDAVVVQVEAQTLEQGSQLGHLDVGIAVAVDEEKGIEELVSRLFERVGHVFRIFYEGVYVQLSVDYK